MSLYLDCEYLKGDVLKNTTHQNFNLLNQDNLLRFNPVKNIRVFFVFFFSREDPLPQVSSEVGITFDAGSNKRNAKKIQRAGRLAVPHVQHL